MSILFRPQKNVKDLEGLTIEIAKRIQKIMEQKYNIKLTIKEPNDLMLNGKKICGILTESNTIGNKINYVIISIGFNVNEDKFPNELENIATSLYKETGKEFNKQKIIEDFIKTLEDIIQKKIRVQKLKNIIRGENEKYRNHSNRKVFTNN